MLLVDGCNIPVSRRVWHPLEWSWRRRLVVDVARLTQHWESCADVVFDGRAPPRFAPFEGAVRVWFSCGRTADDVIVDLAAGVPEGELIVATSDRGLARRVQRYGARVVASRTLREALDRVCAAAHVGSPSRMALLEGPEALLAAEDQARAG